MSSLFALLIAFFILLLAISMKVVAKTSDSRTVFKLSLAGFLLLYVLAALAISYLNPSLPKANVESFSRLLSPAQPVGSDPVPGAPPQDVIIRQ